MNTPDILAIPFGYDNLAWLVRGGTAAECAPNHQSAGFADGVAVVIDPGDARAVMGALTRARLSPIAFLCTHSDSDHIAGLSTLAARFPEAAVAARNPAALGSGAGRARILSCRDGEELVFGRTRCRCLETPGHSADSLCFYFDCGALFSGDTLFAAGCGRVRAHAYEAMFQSLGRLAHLPPETCVYPGHNYLEENLRFAATLPHDASLLHRRKEALADGREPPSTLAMERMTNPFLRTIVDEAFVRALYSEGGASCAPPPDTLEVFTKLRIRKNTFA